MPPTDEHGMRVRHPIVRYGLALAITVLAGILRGALGALVSGLVPFATFFPAVLASTLVGGIGPGILSTLLSALWAWYFWLPPFAELAPPTTAAGVNLVLFALACLVLVATAEAARRYYGRSLAGERRFRAAEDLAADPMGILETVRDPAGDVADLEWSYANPAMARLLRAESELVGRQLLEKLPGHRSHPVLFPTYRRVIETGTPEEVEIFYDADGIRGWFRVNAVKLNDGVAIALRDITGRKKREAALEESEARFRLLADAVDDVFWIIDVPRREVIYASPACERVWGLSRETLYSDPAAWRRNVHPEDRALADPVFDEMLAGRRETFELVYRMRRPDGSVRWVRDKGWLVRAGDVERVVGIMTDISAEKASEEKQRLLARELDHRLRNTFALMQSMVRLSARNTDDPDELVAGIETRIHALARGQELVVRGSGQTASLAAIVRESLAPHAGQWGRAAIEGPAVQVAASAVPLFHMAFHELATNATKYGALSVPSGRVEVRWQRRGDERRQALHLTWRESGGPIVRPPTRRGFGSTLVEQALATEFRGEIEIAFPPEGVVCTMRLPVSERLMVSDTGLETTPAAHPALRAQSG